MSFKVGIRSSNDTSWVYNGLRFATKEEAENYQFQLITSWSSLEHSCVSECGDQANYTFDGGQIKRIGDVDRHRE